MMGSYNGPIVLSIVYQRYNIWLNSLSPYLSLTPYLLFSYKILVQR